MGSAAAVTMFDPGPAGSAAAVTMFDPGPVSTATSTVAAQTDLMNVLHAGAHA